jgi:iron complex outermembrane receptor protein
VKKWLALLLSAMGTVCAEEGFDELLEAYQSASDLSRITKVESAGIVVVYKRDELDRMQAKTLDDVLKLLPVLHYSRTSNNLPLFAKAQSGSRPPPVFVFMSTTTT